MPRIGEWIGGEQGNYRGPNRQVRMVYRLTRLGLYWGFGRGDTSVEREREDKTGSVFVEGVAR